MHDYHLTREQKFDWLKSFDDKAWWVVDYTSNKETDKTPKNQKLHFELLLLFSEDLFETCDKEEE